VADSFTDHRGTITDLLVTPLDAVTRITSVAGAIRGNHVHAETTQWTLVLSGRLAIVTEKDGYRRRTEYAPGEMACEEPGVPHAWLALTDTEVLVFTKGPRSGAAYESDTQRLTVPLIDPEART
jgi:quercetin dioxygenase-like cupin family protein